MVTLVLGVLDVAYSDSQLGGKTSSTTTGEVAEILEKRYAVMQSYFDLHKGEIADDLANGMAASLQDLINGRTATGSPFYGAEQKIEAGFRRFLDANEMQKLSLALTGTPISAAAQAGVSHRKKRPYAKRAGRSAFVDTGLYRSSFRAEVNF